MLYQLKQPNKIENLYAYQLVHQNNPMIRIIEALREKEFGLIMNSNLFFIRSKFIFDLTKINR